MGARNRRPGPGRWPALAYPEFEAYVEKVSGMPVNCSLCHTHPDGPEGLNRDEIGSLK